MVSYPHGLHHDDGQRSSSAGRCVGPVAVVVAPLPRRRHLVLLGPARRLTAALRALAGGQKQLLDYRLLLMSATTLLLLRHVVSPFQQSFAPRPRFLERYL